MNYSLYSIESIPFFLLSQVLFGFCIQMMYTPQFSLIADSVDAHEKNTGKRNDAMSMSACLFVIKLGGALGGAGMGMYLSKTNYTASGVNPESAVNAINMMFTVIPSALAVLAAGIAYLFLTKSRSAMTASEA